ncbi:MAG: gamma-glutamyl-gamma-aminobutyrate hydrolase family protein [Nanoarchaeota archaeon]|nr:gamma-glutamyl-gamma-aminobutyrate hydrolase family protein [Nanoarchaeota archaeon]
MILIINICKEKLHYLEFVKPIEDILKKEKIEYQTIYYKKITDKELLNKKLEKIIICGTSLKDNEYLENLDSFKWIKFPKLTKPILGICGGMQIISLIFGGVLIENKEIGQIKIKFEKEFLNFKPSLNEVYLLHNYAVISNEFEVFASSSQEFEIPQAVKHKTKPIYGVLFHPEVRNKELISYFCEKI